MRKVLPKHRDQRARYRQVPQRHPFKCSARRPSCRCFPDEPRRDPIRPLFETDCALVPSSGAHFRAPGERRLISSILLPLHFVHSRSPVLLLASGDRRLLLFLLCDASFTALVPIRSVRLCVIFSFPSQLRIGHPRIRAILASSFIGFTAAGRPATSISQRSFKLSPYA